MDNFDLKKYLTEGKLHEAMFDVATTEKIAQKIADEFTAEDSNDLDLKYVVSPGVEAGHFDLDVEAGPNTPGEDWKDENGFGIENYLGQYAGGSFLIRDGVVINAAMRSAPVANVTPEGEVEMISAEESRAAIGMEEEIKSNKMKKSELKEMIRNAFLNETEIEEADIDAAAVQSDENEAMDQVDEADKESFDDAFDRIDKSKEVYQGSDKDEVKEAEEDEEVEVDADVDVDVDAEEGGEEVAASEEEEIDVKEKAKVNPNVKAVQDALTIAQAAAAELGDDKLTDQIGNTITFFTRAHVASVDKEAMAEDLNVNEVTFPMWTKINK